jgi:excisionase family DNA binding protein
MAAATVALAATLTNDEAARYIGVSPATLATWRSTRDVEIAHVRIGRRIVYRRVDLDRFLADHLVGVGA